MSANIELVEALFNRAMGFHPDKRAAFLAGACGHDAALLARVRALLEAHEAGEGILPEEPRSKPPDDRIAEKPGDRFGHYKLLEQIGEGGCGVVYLAEQEEPVRRLVALKIIKLGMDTRKVVARFEAERQALALMDHPNIARVYDAGATLNGRPYFVMELVRGVRIIDYCDHNGLSTAQRLDLVMHVCRAIQHAHQKGIIHRDIKPSNVLVTVHDGVPVPKVIDFGIAKAIEGKLTNQTLFTPFEQFVGTPAYMSPEQTELKGLDVDTRTDIYSLGVLLYELLTGKTPFDAQELLSAGLEEMRRTIREKEPLRPSTRLTMELAEADTARRAKRASNHDPESKYRESEIARAAPDWSLRKKELIHVLRGDLDWIVMKCLEKDRARRYETANGLATDLQRHLKGEPVVARPPSNLYRLQKLVRRNKLAFIASTAVIIALALGMIGSTWEAVRAWRAEREQTRLRVEADTARIGEANQRAVAEQHLYDALLGEARAKQLSGQAGQRFESLEAITKAAAMRRSPELSDAAVTAFALTDLRGQKSWRFPSHWVAENLCFDVPFALYAQRTPLGISVRRVADDRELATLPVSDVGDVVDNLSLRSFDPRSHYLAASCATRDGVSHCRVWDLTRDGALALDLDSACDPDFSPDGQAIAVVNGDDTVSVKEIDSGRDLKRFHVDGRVDMLRFNADGSRLAGTELGSTNVRIWEVASGRVNTTLLSPGKLSSFAWNCDGTLLATGGEDGQINICDAQTGRLQTRLEGHQRRVMRLAFSHQGDLLASGAWDHTLRLWDVASGQQLVMYRTPDTDLHFSLDDRTLAYAVAGETASLLEVAHSTGYRRLVGGPEPADWRIGGFSPDGRLLAAGTLVGIGIWDMVAGKEIGLIQTAECRGALFETNGGLSLIGSTAGGLYRWPLNMQSTTGGSFLRAGAPEALAAPDVFGYLAMDRSGTKILAATRNPIDPVLLNPANPTNVLRLPGRPGPGFVALAPDGRWAAKATWKGDGASVYDASTGRLIRELPVKRSAVVAFSPDGNWLATADMMELRLWKTGSWEPLPQTLPGDRVSEINPLAFSPDGRLLAAAHGSYHEIKIVKIPSLEVVATLRAPTPAALTSLSFSPEGSKLAALEWSGHLDLWDLRLTRQELQKVNLDWDLLPFPTMVDSPPSGPATLQLDAAPFSKVELAQCIPSRDLDTAANLIDLTDYFNAPLSSNWFGAKGDKNDFSELPRGVQELAGTKFDLRGLIQIGASAANGIAYPSHISGIPIQQKCRHLRFLHAAIMASAARPGDVLGHYVFHYSDGRQVELPIIAGKDLADWSPQPNEQGMNSETAWTGNNPVSHPGGHTIRLFTTTWENPFPEVQIRQFDFVSAKSSSGQPFLVAVTAEP